MKRFSNRTYRFLKIVVNGFMHILHPSIMFKGRENIPNGAAVLVCNHSALSDPVWVHLALDLQQIPMTMAKKELTKHKLLWALCQRVGGFPVDREGNDIQAIKTSLQCLRDDNKLLIFPEGTRIRNGKRSEPHNGAVMIACRAKTPMLPIYLSEKKHLFSKIKVVIGEPYLPQYEGAKPTAQDLDRLTAEMMDKVYRLGVDL